MKFLVAFLALPAAVLAAPTSSSLDSLACGCMNAKGQVSSSGSCQYSGGSSETSGDLAGYCYRVTTWAAEMNTIFNDALCNPGFDGDHTKAVCKPVKLCPWSIPDYPDFTYYKLC